MISQEREKGMIQKFNNSMKNLLTWKDFQKWFDNLCKTRMDIGIHKNRSGSITYQFRPYVLFPETHVTYLCEGGNKEISSIKNLHFCLEIRS